MGIRLAAMLVAIGYALIVLAISGPDAPANFLRFFGCYAATVLALACAIAALRLAYVILKRGMNAADARSAVTLDRIVPMALPLLTFAVTMAAFTLFKQAVLPTAGFGFGRAVAAQEHALLGMDAWQATHWLLASRYWSQIIDFAYHAWFAPMTLGMVLCVFAARGSVVAQRYMLAFVLVWIVEGSLIAYWLPAAGPCFYDDVQTDPHRFAGLVATLQAQDAALRAAGWPGLAALDYQRQLYRIFRSHEISFGAGISAMPSLHNAMAVLFACAAFHRGRAAGWLFTGYAGVIFIGSVHLGWHYALDGVVALVATMAIWKATGVIAYSVDRSRARGAPTAPGVLEPIAIRINP